MVSKKKAVDPEDSGQPGPEAQKEMHPLALRVEALEKQLNVIRSGCPHAAACFKGR